MKGSTEVPTADDVMTVWLFQPPDVGMARAIILWTALELLSEFHGK
jgi:hypothetical protein